MEKKFCSNCGEKIDVNQKFCPGCGKQIESDNSNLNLKKKMLIVS